MQKFKPVFLTVLRIIIGAILGYTVYYYALMEIISLYSTLSEEIYILTSIVALIASIAACILLVFILTKGKINKNVFYIISSVYFFTDYIGILRSAIARQNTFFEYF